MLRTPCGSQTEPRVPELSTSQGRPRGSDGTAYERESDQEAKERRENEARMAQTLRALEGFGGNDFSLFGFGGDPWRR